MSKVLKINFSNEKALNHFMDWLSGQGEQDYWIWMECREQEDNDAELTAVGFDYSKKNEIDTTCGRLDKR